MEQRTDEHTDDIKRENSEDKFRKDFWQLSEGESASTIFYKLKEGFLNSTPVRIFILLLILPAVMSLSSRSTTASISRGLSTVI